MGLVHCFADRLRLDYRLHRRAFEMGGNLTSLAARGTGWPGSTRFNAEGGGVMMKIFLAQRRKDAKRYRVSKRLFLRLCAFAREISCSLATLVVVSLLTGCNVQLP